MFASVYIFCNSISKHNLQELLPELSGQYHYLNNHKGFHLSFPVNSLLPSMLTTRKKITTPKNEKNPFKQSPFSEWHVAAFRVQPLPPTKKKPTKKPQNKSVQATEMYSVEPDRLFQQNLTEAHPPTKSFKWCQSTENCILKTEVSLKYVCGLKNRLNYLYSKFIRNTKQNLTGLCCQCSR